MCGRRSNLIIIITSRSGSSCIVSVVVLIIAISITAFLGVVSKVPNPPIHHNSNSRRHHRLPSSVINKQPSLLSSLPPPPASSLTSSSTTTMSTRIQEEEIQLPHSKAPGLLYKNPNSKLAVVVTHPWGPLGGNLHNNVVRAGARYFQSLGITTLRFNFVGWQLSWGNYQRQQIIEASQFLLTSDDDDGNGSVVNKILIIGYSYGSLLAASAASEIPQCIGVVSIAPPYGVQHWLLLFNSNQHLRNAVEASQASKLLLMGDHDNFTTLETFEKTIQQWYNKNNEENNNANSSSTTKSIVIKNADHFFHRKEKEIFDLIGNWLLQDVYPPESGQSDGIDLKQLSSI